MRPRIVTDPAVQFGRPCIRGVLVDVIAEHVFAGELVDSEARKERER